MNPVISSQTRMTALAEIEQLDAELEQHFKRQFSVQPILTRSLVSFQANKERPVYRWYKYKEAFSASLVEYLFERYIVTKGKVLDPFAGSGTALFVASAFGIDAEGIELLPIGQQIIETKRLLETEFMPEDFETLRRWAMSPVWLETDNRDPLPELRITRGAYPQATRDAIERYLGACQHENHRVRAILRLALLCVF